MTTLANLVTPAFLDRLSERVPYIDGRPDFSSVEWADYEAAMSVAEAAPAPDLAGPNPLVEKLRALAHSERLH